MALNFKLFENFKEAAKQHSLEVVPGPGYHSIKLENGRYIFCWTPINKMFQLSRYYENENWDMALKYMKDNFNDFYLEFGGDSIDDMNLVCEALSGEANDSLTTKQISKIIDILKDDAKLEKQLVWKRMKHGVAI